MTPELKAAWLKELRDPSNTKCERAYFPGGLNFPLDKYKDAKCFCALGALIKAQAILDPSYGDEMFPPGVRDFDSSTIMIMNDEGKSFTEIADWMEANVPCNS